MYSNFFKKPDRKELINERDYFFNDYEIYHLIKDIDKGILNNETIEFKDKKPFIVVPRPWTEKYYFSKKEKIVLSLSFIFLLVSLIGFLKSIIFTFAFLVAILAPLYLFRKKSYSQRESKRLPIRNSELISLLSLNDEDKKESIELLRKFEENYILFKENKDNEKYQENLADSLTAVLCLIKDNYIDYFSNKYY